jgi:hypothetical protein
MKPSPPRAGSTAAPDVVENTRKRPPTILSPPADMDPGIRRNDNASSSESGPPGAANGVGGHAVRDEQLEPLMTWSDRPDRGRLHTARVGPRFSVRPNAASGFENGVKTSFRSSVRRDDRRQRASWPSRRKARPAASARRGVECRETPPLFVGMQLRNPASTLSSRPTQFVALVVLRRHRLHLLLGELSPFRALIVRPPKLITANLLGVGVNLTYFLTN